MRPTVPLMGVDGIRMVPLLTVSGPFQAKVVAARLGSDGILTELRGELGGPYPMGDVHVLVREEDAALARQLLLADEVEDAFAHPLPAYRRPTGAERARAWLVAGAIVLVGVAGVLSRFV